MTTFIKSGLIAAVLVGVSACTTTDITSSTSSTLDAVTPDVTLNQFIDTRMASIQHEAARGHGENLEALAQLMGEPDSAAFSQLLHVHYDVLFDDVQQPSELVSRIANVRAEQVL